ncbi:MAG: hypothetical protein WD081_08405 [Gammaproteobacteria bacterium]
MSTPAFGGGTLTFSGDIRSGVLGSETRLRTGTIAEALSWRTRARAGAHLRIGTDWSLVGRAAGRFDTEQRDLTFELDFDAPGPGGLADGQATIDTLHVLYAPADGPWRIRLGRFQTAFELEGVAKKSLDRLDSPSFDVTWTDGAWVEHRGGAWTGHVILQYNDADGPSNALRRPLVFDAGESRVGLFAALSANEPRGPLVQRVLTVTWLPGALRPFGPGSPLRDDHLSVTAKSAAAWRFGSEGTRLLVAGEAGYARNTPRQTILGSGNDDALRFGWQVSLSVIDVVPSHSIGIVYGRVADGWLISPDYSPNQWALEARWLWRLNAAWAVDARIRRRAEIDLPFPSLHPRRYDDFYLRATWRY